MKSHESRMQALRCELISKVMPIREDIRAWILQDYSGTFGYKRPISVTSRRIEAYDEAHLTDVAINSDWRSFEALEAQFDALAAREVDVPQNQRLRVSCTGTGWELCGNRDEKLRVDFEQAVIRAGIALRAGSKSNPTDDWLEQLRLYLLWRDSDNLFPRNDPSAIILRPLISSAMFCSSLVGIALAADYESSSAHPDPRSLGAQATELGLCGDVHLGDLTNKRLVEIFIANF